MLTVKAKMKVLNEYTRMLREVGGGRYSVIKCPHPKNKILGHDLALCGACNKRDRGYYSCQV